MPARWSGRDRTGGGIEGLDTIVPGRQVLVIGKRGLAAVGKLRGSNERHCPQDCSGRHICECHCPGGMDIGDAVALLAGNDEGAPLSLQFGARSPR